MVTVFAPVHEITPEEFRRVTEVTYLGQVHGTLAALKRMRPRNHGTIVQVGSALGYRAIPLQSAYCAAKFAIRGFTDSLRSELEHEGSRIRLTMVQLPAVNTPQFDWARSRMPNKTQPLAPIFQPEAIAREVVRAASEAPRELWIWPFRLEGDHRNRAAFWVGRPHFWQTKAIRVSSPASHVMRAGPTTCLTLRPEIPEHKACSTAALQLMCTALTRAGCVRECYARCSGFSQELSSSAARRLLAGRGREC